MTAASMVEMGGLLIIAAVTLQVLIALRAYLARQSLAGIAGGVVEGGLAGSESAESERPQMWLGKRKFQVAMKVPENFSGDICSFYLVALDRRPIPRFKPGQFLMLELPVMQNGRPVTRCYSISNSPDERRYYRISVKRIPGRWDTPLPTPPGLASSFLHDEIREGDIVEAFAPSGSFTLLERSSRPVVLIAGGVGITPVLSMLNWLLVTRSRREIWFFYGVQNREQHAMYDYLVQVRRNHQNVKLFVAYSRPHRNCQPGWDYNVEGHVCIDLLRSVLPTRDCEFYMCGPNSMTESLTEDLIEWGVAAEHVMSEAFMAAPGGAEAASDTSPASKGKGETYRIEFARSGEVVEWTEGAADTLLELAEANGIPVRCSCRAGSCGTCLASVLEGEGVDYVRPPGKETAQGTCLPCIARPKSDMVLDL